MLTKRSTNKPQRSRDGLNMRILLSFLLGLNSIGLLSGAEAEENTLSCLNDYMFTVRCILNTSSHPLQVENVSHWLEFVRHDNETFECSLVKVMDDYYCTFESREQFIDSEHFVIALCSKTNGNTHCLVMDNMYMPAYHIKPTTPGNLNVCWNSGQYKFTWENGYEKYTPPVFQIQDLKYHLQYYKLGHVDSALMIHPFNTIQYIDAINFEPDTEYIAKVRSSPDQGYYQGQWSEWSPVVQWRTNASQDVSPPMNADVFLFIGSLALPVCVMAGLLFFLCLSPSIRLKIKSCSKVPTPAAYFQTLYSHYDGDFQSWLVSSGNLGEPFKIEEVLKIDTLTEATPVDDEDKFLSLAFYQTQCQPAYVNPCGTNRDDSGCEDPIRSVDSSWPHDAVLSFEAESMAYSEDYCTLSDTHIDLIPTNGVEQSIFSGSSH
ncbi:hypothetical protein MATL_G00010020 [Megalops atlanticus]|uniref:Fibronectin type-III domain-containing protein n=1 Tax=Megalops atlanticus TaxID=7932 RepID=A0A9D3QL44_MEGAT|nr:hypothetical protein MATL_G00010020 [Megalops atlanticus]